MKKPARIIHRLNTTQLIDVVAADADVPVDETYRVVIATFDAIARATAGGHDVAITRFGTWISSRARRTRRRNPQTGEMFMSPAHQVVRFRVAPALADAVRRRDRSLSIRKTRSSAKASGQ
ncbi:HU family DNA-binding protein [Streptomyces sp. NPDC020800]|uniref:HU family DNA-binding protein n=1 Tax=Streptomyces sp. NPDC020800 TaxID=3365092 RepID=UPI00379E02F6